MNTDTSSLKENAVDINAYIKRHWQKMSDEDIAKKLGISPYIVSSRREKMRLHRRGAVQKLRMLTFDIETSPHKAAVWQKYDTNAVYFDSYGVVLSIAWKWWNENKTHVISLPDYHGYKPGKENDKDLLKEFAKVYDEADIIIYQNGDRFDLPYLNTRMLFHRMRPLKLFRPSQVVDTLKAFKRHFRFPANSLDDVCEYLQVGRKIKTDKELWRACLSGDRAAWKHMCEYNQHDVKLTEEVAGLILPYMATAPNYNLFAGTIIRCPNVGCGSANVEARNYAYTRVSAARRYHCMDCGKWFQGKAEKRDVIYR